MGDAVTSANFIQHVYNVKVSRASNKIISFFPTFSSLVGTTYYDIDAFITAVNGAKSGRALAQIISIPVGVIMHLNALHFELDDRNNCDALPGAEILAVVDIAQIIVMRSTPNQDTRDNERLRNTSMPELTVQNFTTSNFESFMYNIKSDVYFVGGIHGVPFYYLLGEFCGNYKENWESWS